VKNRKEGNAEHKHNFKKKERQIFILLIIHFCAASFAAQCWLSNKAQ